MPESEARIQTLEGQLVGIAHSWSIALTRPLRALKPALEEAEARGQALAEGRCRFNRT